MNGGAPALRGHLGVFLLCLALGTATVLYVDRVGDSPLRVALLPLGLILLAMLVVDRRGLFLFIMLLRAAADPYFDAAKFSIGGTHIGMGGAINALVILIAGLLAAEKLQARQGPARALPWGWLLPLLLALAAALHAPDKVVGIKSFLALLSSVAVFCVPFAMLRSEPERRLCLDVILASALLPVCHAAAELASGGSGGAEGLRLRGSFSHPNIFAFYLVLQVALLLYRLRTEAVPPPAPRRLLYWTCMLLFFALLALTKTRSAWLACYVLFALYALCAERRLLPWLLAAPLLLALLPGVADRIADLGSQHGFDPYERLNSFDWRLQIWQAGIAWMRPAQFIHGFGLDAFTFYSPQFFPLAGNSNPGAHNIYVQLLFETGVLGLAVLLFIFGRLALALWRRHAADRRGRVVLMMTVAFYLVVAASDNLLDYLAFNWYYWFAMGVLCRAPLPPTRPEHRLA